MDLGLTSTDELLQNHEAVLREFLLSKIMRDDDIVINFALTKLNLSKKVCIRFIADYRGKFCISSQTFGSPSGIPIFLVNVKKHFFLAKSNDPSSSAISPGIASSPISPPSPPPTPAVTIRPYSYESIDFGDPPDMDFGYDSIDFGDPPDMDYDCNS